MIDRLTARSILLAGLLGSVLGVTMYGCSGSDTASTLPILSTNPYTRIQLNVRAAVMATVAPYDTLQLVPTAYDATGHVISLPGPVTYTRSDTSLTVSTTGLVTLRTKTGTNSYVIARMQDTAQNVTHVDTVFILGTTTAPASPIATFSIQPAAGDSTILDIGAASKKITIVTKDASGQLIASSALVAHFVVSDPIIAFISAKTGMLQAASPGTVLVTASTRYYGVAKMDSVRYTIGYPDVTVVTNLLSQNLDGSYQGYFIHADIVIGVNKTVIFEIPYIVANAFYWDPRYHVGSAALGNSGLSVVFDDSSAAQTSPIPTGTLANSYAANGSGNITLTIPSAEFAKDSVDTAGIHYYPLLTTYCTNVPYPCAAARSFSTAGTYSYHSALTGASGTITVLAAPTP